MDTFFMRVKCFFILFSLSSPLLAQSMIAGNVIETTTGLPIKDAVVYLNDKYNIPFENDLRTKTDINGYYEFKNLEIKEYSVNAYVIYEYLGDSIAFVFLSGVVTLRENMDDSPVFKSLRKNKKTGEFESTPYGFRINFGFSKAFFEFTMQTSDKVNIYDHKEAALFSAVNMLTRPKVITNADSFMKRDYIFFTEKKTW